jgi:hypothetical protein
MRIDKKSMTEVLHRERAFSEMFVAYLLTRNIRYEEDLVEAQVLAREVLDAIRSELLKERLLRAVEGLQTPYRARGRK